MLNFNVTHRTLSLGLPDATTGWYAKTYSLSVIQMIVLPKAAQSLATSMGLYVKLDALGLTCDPVAAGDEVETVGHVFYEVKTVQATYLADSFLYRQCDLTELPLHEA